MADCLSQLYCLLVLVFYTGNLLFKIKIKAIAFIPYALYRIEESFRDYQQNIERFFIAPILSWQIGDHTDLSLQLNDFAEEELKKQLASPG